MVAHQGQATHPRLASRHAKTIHQLHWRPLCTAVGHRDAPAEAVGSQQLCRAAYMPHLHTMQVTPAGSCSAVMAVITPLPACCLPRGVQGALC